MIATRLPSGSPAGRAVRVAARVRVIPPARVERVAAEVFESRDARELRHVERPRAHRHEVRRERVAAVGADHPSRSIPVPREVRHPGVEERPVVEPELPPDPPAVLEDLRPMRVLLGRHVPRLLEERHVDEGGRVALGARVAVPVPGAAEVAALLDEADVLDARFLQAGTGDEAGEAAADDGDGDVVELGFARGDRECGSSR